MIKCIRCGDSGKYLGNGMMLTDCNLCDDDTDIPNKFPKINRKTKSYKKAIKDIMALHPSLTNVEAVKMFDEAYEKGT